MAGDRMFLGRDVNFPIKKQGCPRTHHVWQPQYRGLQLHGLRPVQIAFHGHVGNGDALAGSHLEFARPRVGLVERVTPQPLEVDCVYQQQHGGWVYRICKQLVI